VIKEVRAAALPPRRPVGVQADVFVRVSPKVGLDLGVVWKLRGPVVAPNQRTSTCLVSWERRLVDNQNVEGTGEVIGSGASSGASTHDHNVELVLPVDCRHTDKLANPFHEGKFGPILSLLIGRRRDRRRQVVHIVDPHAAVANRVDELVDEDAASNLGLIAAVVVEVLHRVRDSAAVIKDEIGVIDRAAAMETVLGADVP